jgi:hypothetical protein
MSFQVIDKRGVREVGKAPVAASSPETDEDVFDLTSDPQLVKFAHELDWRRQEKLEHEKAIKLIQEIIYARKGNAGTLMLNGQEWAAYRHDGIFAYKKFEAEQPGLFEQFSEVQTVRVLNTNKLRAAHPELYQQYQAATLRRRKD